MTREFDRNGGADGDVDTDALESVFSRIPSVTAARVVTAATGRIAEVHLLARRDRAPKQLVRDVQSVALANFGLDVDYRTVSVVQLDDPHSEAESQRSTGSRISLRRVTAETSGHATEVRVTLGVGDEELSGRARGPGPSPTRLVVRAVADALAPVLGDLPLEVEFADTVPATGYSIALVVLRMATRRGEHVVSGSAVVRNDVNDSFARAALAALNRLPLLTPPDKSTHG